MFKLNVNANHNCRVYFKQYFANAYLGDVDMFYVVGECHGLSKVIHNSTIYKHPVVAALKLPTNVVDINASETGRFSPLRERDISGPVINSYLTKQEFPKIDVTIQPDPHVNKYDCRGALSLSSSMQSNVPSPFSGNHTHLNMPGSQWGQGYKYLSDHLHSAHYLTLRNEYRAKHFNNAYISYPFSYIIAYMKVPILIFLVKLFQSIAVTIGSRNMCTGVSPPSSAKDKLKKAIKEYGSTVIVFHITISLLSLGGFYALVSSGVDVVAILKYFNVGEGTLSKIVASNAGTFVIAYGVHKVFAPLRIAITLTATPFIVRYLRRIGILKSNVNTRK